MSESPPPPPSTAAAPAKPDAQAPWTVRRILVWTTQHFEKRGIDSPRLTSEVLLAHTLKVDRVRLYVDIERPLEKSELATFRGLIERRAAGEPTQYLTGQREFYNRPFKVDPRVLIPRPETELLVEAALRKVAKDAPAELLDLCTGSGCIALSLAAERPRAKVTATDLSPGALAVAKENAAALGVGERVELLEGDLFAPLARDRRFDVIVSNPPYIATAEIDTLSAEVRREPRSALDGGPDGLGFYRRIAAGAGAYLVSGGLLALEIGETQGPSLLALLNDAGFADVRVEQDLERRDRLALGTHRGGPATGGVHG